MPELDEMNPQTETQEAPAKGRRKKSRETQSNNNTTHYVPGEPKDGYFAEKWRIIKERRLLRKDLKAKGIKSREDFELIAESLGLVLWKDSPFLLWWHFFWGGIRKGLGLWSLLLAATMLLITLFLISIITESKGSFTINLTADMLRAGFVLYDNREFEGPETRLFSEELMKVNNITLDDIPKDVDEIDGPHNGKNYVAYTFYLRNEGEEVSDYIWYMNFLSETLNVGDAVWIMLFQDGDQVIYAQRSPLGEPEELYGFRNAPFSEVAYDSNQYYEKDGRFGIVTTPYVQEGIVAQGLLEHVEPGEFHKYTVVIWVEGHDPECTDAIFGGYAKYSIDFDYVDDGQGKNLFSGLYRTEYRDYGLNPDAE